MEVACNLAPFGAASNNNLNPILENNTVDEMNNIEENALISIENANANANGASAKVTNDNVRQNG